MLRRLILTAFVLIFAMPVASTATPLETLHGLAMGFTADVPIIMYHTLEDTPDNKWEITAAEFESDLKYLADNGFTAVVMQDLIDFVHNGAPLPQKPIVLSFDDGRSPTIDVVLDLLEKYDSKITMAIIGKETDKYAKIEADTGNTRHPHMTWQDVKKAANSGRVEISCHTYDLHGRIGARKKRGESNEAYRARFLADLEKFAMVLQDNVGISANSLVYPLGAISDTSDEIIREAGYLASLSCVEKNNTIAVGDTDGLFSLNRFLRPPHQSSAIFFARLNHADNSDV